MWATGITDIVLKPMPYTPAAVDPETGVVYVDPFVWRNLNFEARYLLLLHELGHLKAKRENEFIADEWAFNQYAREGLSMKKAVLAMLNLLSFSNREHYYRLMSLYKRAVEHDYLVNKNKNIKHLYDELKTLFH